MAKLSDLVLDLSVVLRIDRTTVNTYARHLREAGMLSQAGRGVNAAEVAPLDVARLLIAMSIPAQAKDAPQTVRDFGCLVCYDCKEDEQKPELTMGRLLHLAPRSTIEAAVAAVVAMYANDEALSQFDEAGSDRYRPGLAVQFDCTMRTATLWIGPHRYLFHHPVVELVMETMRLTTGPRASEYDLARMTEVYAEEAALHKRYFRGIRQTSMISGVEFDPIGEMLAGHRAPGHVESEEEANARLLNNISVIAERQTTFTAPGASVPGQHEDDNA